MKIFLFFFKVNIEQGNRKNEPKTLYSRDGPDTKLTGYPAFVTGLLPNIWTKMRPYSGALDKYL